jgi:hypothetical protein
MMISLAEALAWIETRNQAAVDAWLNRPGSAFDHLFGLNLEARFYPNMAAETQSRARGELGWVSVEPEPVAALMSAIEGGKLEVFGTRHGAALPELITAEAWGPHGLKLFGSDGDRYQGSSGIYAARSRQGPCVFFDLAVKRAALLELFPPPDQGARPASVAWTSAAAWYRAEGAALAESALREKGLAITEGSRWCEAAALWNAMGGELKAEGAKASVSPGAFKKAHKRVSKKGGAGGAF